MPKNLDPDANSEKALDKQIHRELLKETKKIKKAFGYTNDGEAFVHVFVRAYLDISDDDAAEAAQVGVSGHDKGIDAFYVDESDKVVHIFGGTLESRSFGPEILVDVGRAIDFLRSPLPANIKPDLQTIWSIYEKHMSMGNGFSTHYAFVTLGRTNDEAKKGLGELRKKMEKENWDIDVFERRDALAWVSFPFLLKGPDAEFTTPEEPLIFAPAKFRSAVFPIKASELVDIVTKHRYTVFGLNLREYFGRNPVNRQIAKTLDDPKDIELFWYLNLGVDAICDHFDTVPTIQRKLLGENKGQTVKVRNLRIVNGIQTSVMLRDHRDKIANSYLMLRLIETKDTSLAYKIAVAKNRQTPIRGRDLFAQEPVQLALEHAATHFAKPFFYERRERDWETNRNRPEIRHKFGQRVIRNDEAARSYLATVLQRPYEAEHFGRRIFYEYAGLYEEVFTNDLDIRNLIVADEILQVAADQQKGIRYRFKELNQKNLKETLSDDERNELRDSSHLVHAKWYLMALLSYFVVNFTTENDQKRLFTLDRPISKAKRGRLERLHEISAKLVRQYMIDKEDAANKQHLRFAGARYLFALKGTYANLKDTARVWVDRDAIKQALE